MLSNGGIGLAFAICVPFCVLCVMTLRRLARQLYLRREPDALTACLTLLMLLALQPAAHFLAQNVSVHLTVMEAGLGSVLFFPMTFVVLFLLIVSARAGAGRRLLWWSMFAVALGNVPNFIAATFSGEPLRALVGPALLACDILFVNLALRGFEDANVALERSGQQAIDPFDRTIACNLTVLFLDAVAFPTLIFLDAKTPDWTAWEGMLAGHVVGKLGVGLFLLVSIKGPVGELVKRAAKGYRPESPGWSLGGLAALLLAVACVWPPDPKFRLPSLAVLFVLTVLSTGFIRYEYVEWSKSRDSNPGMSVSTNASIVPAPPLSPTTPLTPKQRFDAESQELLRTNLGDFVAYTIHGDRRFVPASFQEVNAQVAAAGLADSDVAYFWIYYELDPATADFGWG